MFRKIEAKSNLFKRQKEFLNLYQQFSMYAELETQLAENQSLAGVEKVTHMLDI